MKISSIVFAISLLAPLSAAAVGPIAPPAGTILEYTTLGQTILTFADWFVRWFFAIIMVLSLVALLYGAFLFLTAGGDASKTGTARSWLLWALVGFAVAILIRTLLTLVCNFFGVTCPAGFGG